KNYKVRRQCQDQALSYGVYKISYSIPCPLDYFFALDLGRDSSFILFVNVDPDHGNTFVDGALHFPFSAIRIPGLFAQQSYNAVASLNFRATLGLPGTVP